MMSIPREVGWLNWLDWLVGGWIGWIGWIGWLGVGYVNSRGGNDWGLVGSFRKQFQSFCHSNFPP